MKRASRLAVYANAAIAVIAALYLFAAPFCSLMRALHEPGLSSDEVPRIAYHWHRSLSARYETWARERVGSGRAGQLSVSDISGTEWPLFSSVFYLWTTDTLQDAWERDPSLSSVMPSKYARGAIEAAAALVADPAHAKWVKDHWGDGYLHHENLFYRMLLISALTSYQKLSGDSAYQAQLRDQAISLANEIDESPFGLLDDYPGECYPVDVLPAIAAIKRADEVLGTDHSAFARRALRAFEGARLDPLTDLPAYVADSKSGQGFGSARGVGMSFMLVWAPELWPGTAKQWFARYVKEFWRKGSWVAGFAEYPDLHPNSHRWLVDVDAGPVLAGYGTAASAFGLGAARANGDFEKAHVLAAQALVASWPLPDGTLLMPRLLSNYADAPYTGEAALLFSLTRRAAVDATSDAGRLPLSVYLGMSVYLLATLTWIGSAIARVLKWERANRQEQLCVAGWQMWIWGALLVLGAAAWMASWGWTCVCLLLIAQFLPRSSRRMLRESGTR